MIVRPYQQEAVTAGIRHIRSDSLTPGILSIPTGGGKTAVAALIVKSVQHKASPPPSGDWLLDGPPRIRRWTGVQGLILWVAPSWEVLCQAHDSLRALAPEIPTAVLGDKPVARKAGLQATHSVFDLPQDGAVVFTTTQTREKTLGDYFHRIPIKGIILDEAHWGEFGKSGKLLRRKAAQYGAWMLSLTATPREFTQDKVIYQIGFQELVMQGYLVAPRVLTRYSGRSFAFKEGPDGDYVVRGVAEDKPRNRAITEDISVHRADYGQTLLFAVNLDHADRMVKLLRRRGLSVASVTGSTPPEDVPALLDRFREGSLKILVAVNRLNMGTDLPNVRTVVITRPTKSEIRFVQMAGRGARLSPGKEYFNLVLWKDVFDNPEQEALLFNSPTFYRGIATRNTAAYAARPQKHSVASDPVVLFNPADAPWARRNLAYVRGMTFGMEIELTAKDGEIPSPMSGNWDQTAKAILATIEETGVPTAKNPVYQYHGHKDLRFWNVEWDSSVGWEVTSPILKNAEGYDEIRVVLEALDGLLDGSSKLVVNHKTGVHVHLAWDSTHPDSVARIRRLIRIVHTAEPALGSLVSPSRLAKFDGRNYDFSEPNPYCKPISRLLDKSAVDRLRSMEEVSRIFAEYHGARYRTLNLASLKRFGTVEARLHSGSVDAEKLLLWLSLWQQMLWSVIVESHNYPSIVRREVITPDGDIAEFARNYLINSNEVAQRFFIERLIERRNGVVKRSWRHAALANWREGTENWEENSEDYLAQAEEERKAREDRLRVERLFAPLRQALMIPRN